MNKKYIFLIALVAVGILGMLGYVMLHKGSAPVPVGTNPFDFTASSSPAGSGQSKTLALSDGSAVSVPDFLPSEQPEWASPAYGYEVTQDESKPYSILFYPNDSSFLLSLIAEPLGEARATGQRELQSQLQLSNEQMCKLKVNVFTSVGVNDSYAGQNLGISYCPGAVQLPY